MKPLVSILIPAFNAEEWIADCIRSALAQSWIRTEIIVVNDGSTDETLVAARQFECDNVHVFTQTNQGAAAARNRAFAFCRGDYVQWLDADDILAPEKITRQMEALDKCRSRRTLLSSSWGPFMYRYRRTRLSPTPLWCDLTPTEWLIRKLGQNLFMPTGTWLVSRDLTEAAGPWNVQLHVDDDGEYFCRVLLLSDGVRFIPDAIMYYRVAGPGSVSYIGKSTKKVHSQWHSIRMHIDYLRSLEDSERVRMACVKYLQNWLIYFYPGSPEIVKEAEEIARNLGGQLSIPKLPWKYHHIKTLFGWSLAKHTQLFLPRVKWSLKRLWDKGLCWIENRFGGAPTA